METKGDGAGQKAYTITINLSLEGLGTGGCDGSRCIKTGVVAVPRYAAHNSGTNL